MSHAPEEFSIPDEARESREVEPSPKEMVVDLVRHGESKYTGTPPDLTARGQAQIESYAEGLVKDIDPEHDTVVLWHSPMARTEGSADIIQQELGRGGGVVAKRQSIPTMRMMDIKNPEQMEDVWNMMVTRGMTEGEILEHEVFQGTPNETVETMPEMERRSRRLLNGLRYAFEHVDPGERRLRIIGVSHFEILNPLLSKVFHLSPKEGLEKGEGARLTFGKQQKGDSKTSQTTVSIQFRGQTAGPFIIDPTTRELMPAEKE